MNSPPVTIGSSAPAQGPVEVYTIRAVPPAQDKIKLRVAAYARVSTVSEDQLNSFAAQNQYYTALIRSHPHWEFVDLYADKGVTGTSIHLRRDFQRMLSDCRRGNIDRILVKSISRFARNTTECLETLRELKQLGVSVAFEKENIDTGTLSSEMMVSFFASFAQSESETISSNLRWSYRRRMQSGEFITCKAPFGYRLEHGLLRVEPREAAAVQTIFREFLSGTGTERIAELLTQEGIPTRSGGPWQRSGIVYILQNEKYIGDALLQKRYSTGSFPFVQKINHGEVTQYYLEETQPAIIDRSAFLQAQKFLSHRGNNPRQTGKQPHLFTTKLRCGSCSAFFHHKISNGTAYWICRTHNQKGTSCSMPLVREEDIKETFLRLYFKLKHSGPAILEEYLQNLYELRSRRLLWHPDVIELNQLLSDLYAQDQMLTQLNAQGLLDPDIFITQSNELAEQLRSIKQKKEALMSAEDRTALDSTRELLQTLEAGPDFSEEFQSELFDDLVELVTVDRGPRLRFRLKNGLELTEPVERSRAR